MSEIKTVYGWNLDKLSDKEILERVGVGRFADYQLIEVIEEIQKEIGFAREYEDVPRLRDVVSKGSVFCYEAYRRFYNHTRSLANTIRYWLNPTHISELYNAMKWDKIFEMNHNVLMKMIEEEEKKNAGAQIS